MPKIIYILCDGLRKDTAINEMGYLHQLTNKNKATFFTIQTELPTLSRTMYESICTGTPPDIHGITSNLVLRRSKMPNIFQIMADHQLTNAIVAYYWFSELYIHFPYDPLNDKDINPPLQGFKIPEDQGYINPPMQFGRFYEACTLNNDEDIINQGAALIHQYRPDFIMIHPMSIDTVGHEFTSDSKQYRTSARILDNYLSRFIDDWHNQKYEIFIGADHGMNSDGQHGGSSEELSHTPLFYLPSDGKGKGWSGLTCSQLAIAPTILSLMGLPIPETMKTSPIEL